jgi:uncharacterized Fe-S cluster protein YjdI
MMDGCDREASLKKNRISISLGKSPCAHSRNCVGTGAMLAFEVGCDLRGRKKPDRSFIIAYFEK